MMTALASRRALLGGIVALPALTLAGTAVAQSGHPTCDSIALLAEVRGARTAITNLDEFQPDYDEEEERLWNVVDRCESAIHDDNSPSAAEAKLWVAISHMLHSAEDDAAVTRGDLEYLARHSEDYDWSERLIISALIALNGGGAN